MGLEPEFTRRDYPWLGGTAELFTRQLGDPAVGDLHGFLRHVFERERYRLTVLYQGTCAVAAHCLYRQYPAWWTMDDDARRFAPRQLRATSAPLRRSLLHERRRDWWTIAEPRVPVYVVRAIADGLPSGFAAASAAPAAPEHPTPHKSLSTLAVERAAR
ncbi:MAG: hypothetical protein ACYDCQ_12140 [Dehalococcoidia bacterium]